MEKGDGEGWRKEGWGGMEKEGGMRSGGGMGNRTHSPELVVACILVIACFLVVAHVLIVTRVLIVTHVLIVAHVCSCVLAIICELWWPFWLVVVRVLRGLWTMVKGGRQWVVVAGCGQWMVAGDCSWAVGSCRGHGRLCPFMGAGTHLACDVACHVIVIVAGGGCERMVMVAAVGDCGDVAALSCL